MGRELYVLVRTQEKFQLKLTSAKRRVTLITRGQKTSVAGRHLYGVALSRLCHIYVRQDLAGLGPQQFSIPEERTFLSLVL